MICGIKTTAMGQEQTEAAVVESREPQPRPAATCYGHVSRPGSPLRSGALGLLLAPSRLVLGSSFGRWTEGRARPHRAQPSSAGPPPVCAQVVWLVGAGADVLS